MQTCTCLLFLALTFLGLVLSANIPEDQVAHSRVKRVIGGTSVKEGEWPWLVHLHGKVPVLFLWGVPIAHNQYYCGGSILNEKWILTAAHCFKQTAYPDSVKTPEYWNIRAGEVDADGNFYDSILHYFGEALEIQRFQTWNVEAEKIIIHPHYKELDDWQHDVALVKLEKALPVATHPNISPVHMPKDVGESWPPTNEDCVMKGWGCASNNGPLQSVARATYLPKVDDWTCSRTYAIATTTRMCAGFNLEGRGICKGDSGGPLVCRHNNTWKQAGIASFTSRDRPEDFPGVFTRTTEYMDWIQNTIETN